MTCQVNWGHVAVVVEDDGEGHLLCHLRQPGGGNAQVVVVVVGVSFYLSASLVSLLILLKMSVLKPFRTSLMSRISYLSSPRKKESFKGCIDNHWQIACYKKLDESVLFRCIFMKHRIWNTWQYKFVLWQQQELKK